MPSPAKTTTSSGKSAVNQNDRSKPRNGLSRVSVSSTVAKAIGIVDILASKGENGINLAELSELIDMPKSSTHRYLATLQELGLAERKGGDRFCLGTKVIELAGEASNGAVAHVGLTVDAPIPAMRAFRKHSSWYTKCFPGSAALRPLKLLVG